MTSAGNFCLVAELTQLLNSSYLKDKRLKSLIEELIRDNKAIHTVNVAAMKLKDGELSENDMLIYLNKYRASKSSLLGDENDQDT